MTSKNLLGFVGDSDLVTSGLGVTAALAKVCTL